MVSTPSARVETVGRTGVVPTAAAVAVSRTRAGVKPATRQHTMAGSRDPATGQPVPEQDPFAPVAVDVATEEVVG